MKTREIVKGNNVLNFALNDIVNSEMDKTLDEMIQVVEDWKKNTETISCETVINMLKANKSV